MTLGAGLPRRRQALRSWAVPSSRRRRRRRWRLGSDAARFVGPHLFIYLFLVGFAGRVSAPSLLGGEGVGGGPAPRGSWSRGRNAA